MLQNCYSSTNFPMESITYSIIPRRELRRGTGLPGREAAGAVILETGRSISKSARLGPARQRWWVLADTGMPGCRQAANGAALAAGGAWFSHCPASRGTPGAAAGAGPVCRGGTRLAQRSVPPRRNAAFHRRPHHGQPFDP